MAQERAGAGGWQLGRGAPSPPRRQSPVANAPPRIICATAKTSFLPCSAVFVIFSILLLAGWAGILLALRWARPAGAQLGYPAAPLLAPGCAEAGRACARRRWATRRERAQRRQLQELAP